jgi:hypothetical protein
MFLLAICAEVHASCLPGFGKLASCDCIHKTLRFLMDMPLEKPTPTDNIQAAPVMAS